MVRSVVMILAAMAMPLAAANPARADEGASITAEGWESSLAGLGLAGLLCTPLSDSDDDRERPAAPTACHAVHCGLLRKEGGPTVRIDQ